MLILFLLVLVGDSWDVAYGFLDGEYQVLWFSFLPIELLVVVMVLILFLVALVVVKLFD